MTRYLTAALLSVSTLAVGLGIWGAFGLARIAYTALEETANASKTLSAGVSSTIANINRPCKGPKGPDACGLLAQVNKVAIDSGDAIITTQLQVKATQPVLLAAAGAITESSTHLSTAAEALAGTAKAASGALDQATADLKTAQPSIAATKPVLDKLQVTQDRLNVTIATVNDGLKSAAVTSMVKNFSSMTASGSEITADLHVWSHPFLNPEPCKTFKCNFGRHIWPVIQTTLGLGADANQIRMLTGHPLPVSVQP